MENNQIKYVGKSGANIPKDVKEYILKKIKDSGKSVADISKEHGVGKTAIYKWLKEETAGSGDPQLFRLQKENQRKARYNRPGAGPSQIWRDAGWCKEEGQIRPPIYKRDVLYGWPKDPGADSHSRGTRERSPVKGEKYE